MLVDLVLHNAKICMPEGVIDAGIAIDEGKILRIAREPNLPGASKSLDVKGKMILPGLIDPHVHMRDQQLAYKEDFFSGTSAAAAGGVTSIIDMPNNEPVTMSSESLKERMRLADRRAVVNVAFHSAFPEIPGEIRQIVAQGAVAFKLYLSQKVGRLNIEDDNALLRAFREASELEVPVSVHAEDKKTLEAVKKEMQQAGHGDVDAYLTVHSPYAELLAIQHVTQLAKKTSIHIHFCHLSSADGLNAFLAAKNMGVSVSCEATPHHLLLSSKHLRRHGTVALTDPPLRRKEDVEALWNAFRHRRIDALASDHAPHTVEEKEAESIWDVRAGLPGLETTLPLLLTQVNAGKLAMSDLIMATSKRPAEIFHLRGRGNLTEGSSADLVVVDMKQSYKIDSSKFYSKAKYSPFDGWRVRGKPTKTFVNGRLAMEDGEIIAKPGAGQILRWEG